MPQLIENLDSLTRPAPRSPRIIVSRVRGAGADAICHCWGIKAVLEGQETYHLDGQVRVVNAGEFIVLPPGQRFHAGTSRDTVAVGLCIDMPVGTGSLVREHADAVFAMADSTLGQRLLKTWDALESGKPVEDLCADFSEWLTLHSDRMARLSARRRSTRRDLYARVELARRYLHANEDRTVSLNELSKAAALSPHHLNRVFRQVVGEPPARYQRRLRLNGAARALSQGRKTPTELALDLGYSDLPAFTRAFRRVHGTAPSSFARAHC